MSIIIINQHNHIKLTIHLHYQTLLYLHNHKEITQMLQKGNNTNAPKMQLFMFL